MPNFTNPTDLYDTRTADQIQAVVAEQRAQEEIDYQKRQAVAGFQHNIDVMKANPPVGHTQTVITQGIIDRCEQDIAKLEAGR